MITFYEKCKLSSKDIIIYNVKSTHEQIVEMKIALLYNLTAIQTQHDMETLNQTKLLSVQNTQTTSEIQTKLQKEQT